MKGDKLGRQGGSGGQEQPRMEIMKRDKPARQNGRQPRAAQNGDHEGGQAWETRRQRRPRAAQNEIMKGDKLGRQGGSGSQEQPRMEIMKGDK